MTTLFFDIRRFAYGGFFLFILCGRCFGGELNTVAAQTVPFAILAKRIDAAIKNAETNENARRDQDVRSQIFGYAVQQVNAMGKQGDRAALPFLEEKSLSTNIVSFIRERAAAAYVKIADLDESVGLMRKLNQDASAQGAWRYLLNKAFLEKVKLEEKSLQPKTREEISSFLLEIVQNAKTPGDARNADLFLLDRIPEYADSKQRATLNRYANTGTEYTTNTFNPIKAHFDKIPTAKRVDLRKRFPDLPPLPEDKNAGTPLKVALAIGAGLVAICVAIWIMAMRRKRNHADRQLNLR